MLEDLVLYKKYVDLMYYGYSLMVKYPKCERYGIVADIKNNLTKGLEDIINYNKYKKIIFLDDLDKIIKVLLVLIRISYKMKYITNKNYSAFSKKLNIINNLRVGLYISNKNCNIKKEQN